MAVQGNDEAYTVDTGFPDVDLEVKGNELGITHFFLTFYPFNGTDARGLMVPIGAIRKAQRSGVGAHCFGQFMVLGNQPEIYFIPDPRSLTQFPQDPTLGYLACELFLQGKKWSPCPRRKLREKLEELGEMGYVLKSGVELEFWLLEPDTHAAVKTAVNADRSVKFWFSQLSCNMQMSHGNGFLQELLNHLEKLGWRPYVGLQEGLPGQMEVNWQYSDALTSADRHAFFKLMVKDLARRKGMRATFMPMPFGCDAGNGFHLHFSLWDKSTDKPLFPATEKENSFHGFSDLAKLALGGLMQHLDGLTPIMCQTKNSYVRLLHDYAFFTHKTYGPENRWATIRLVQDNRFEIRMADAAVNPYLYLAAVTIAVMDGITNKLEPSEKNLVTSDGFFEPGAFKGIDKVPTSLLGALEKLKEDKVLREGLGELLVEKFCAVKNFLWDDFMKEITKKDIEFVDDY